MRSRLALTFAFCCLLPLAAKKKKEETQVLELPKDPPLALVVPTRNLVFQVSPLVSKGLLSAQTRESVKALLRLNNGATIVKIRAFVAGTGDMRRVPAIISETLTEKKLPLPVVSLVQAGGLPLEGAQVVLESIAVAKREVNPAGILFVSGQQASSLKPLEAPFPLAEKAVASLSSRITGEALRVTCFTSSLDDGSLIHALLLSKFPNAAIDVVETQRSNARSVVECEAVTRLMGEIPNSTESFAVTAPKLAFTGTQLAFGPDDNAARLAFQRLDRALEPLGASTKSAAMASFYPLSNATAERLRKIRLEFFDPAHAPATTMLPFEGLPSLDASFAMDVAAVVP